MEGVSMIKPIKWWYIDILSKYFYIKDLKLFSIVSNKHLAPCFVSGDTPLESYWPVRRAFEEPHWIQ